MFAVMILIGVIYQTVCLVVVFVVLVEVVVVVL